VGVSVDMFAVLGVTYVSLVLCMRSHGVEQSLEGYLRRKNIADRDLQRALDMNDLNFAQLRHFAIPKAPSVTS
jgi:hypothetical protein